MKIAVITCHNNPNYIRAYTLREALLKQKVHKISILKNRKQGLLRYPEVMLKLIKLRFTVNPDVYILTFRGYEILGFTRFISFRKKLIFDEFINPIEWLEEPHQNKIKKLVPKKLLKLYYRRLLKKVDVILADTSGHAKYSSRLMNIPINKYRALPVSTDEYIFKPDNKIKKLKGFNVFYYGEKMTPLHGLDVIMDATKYLKNYPINFLIVGGSESTRNLVKKQDNPRVEYKNWIAFELFPYTIRKHQLCLGGPFGKSTQANYVITGKTYQFLACGAPTIVGNTQVSDDFKDKVNSLSVDLGDSKQLAHQILWAYKNQNKLAKIGNSGHQLYMKKYSIDVLTSQLLSILNGLA